MRILVIGIMAFGLPCSAFAGPVKAEKTAAAVHADKLVGEVNVKPESRAKRRLLKKPVGADRVL